MYHLSRSLYRELVPLLAAPHAVDRRRLLDACEATMKRLATDPDYFANPARTLFGEVRTLFGFSDQARVCRLIELRLAAARAKVEHERAMMRRECGAFTRKGTPCRREALAGARHCASHRELDPVAQPEAA